MDCSPPGSSVHGISQARILEWVDISFSRDFPHNKIPPSGSTNGSSHRSGVWKTNMPAGLVSFEASFLDLQMAAFLSWFFPSECSSLVSLYRCLFTGANLFL